MGLPETWLAVSRLALSRPALSRLAAFGLILSRLTPGGLGMSWLELAGSVRPPGRRIFVICWHADPARHTCSTLAHRIEPDQHEWADRRSGRIGGSPGVLSGER
jgi:hypothetical protein